MEVGYHHFDPWLIPPHLGTMWHIDGSASECLFLRYIGIMCIGSWSTLQSIIYGITEW